MVMLNTIEITFTIVKSGLQIRGLKLNGEAEACV